MPTRIGASSDPEKVGTVKLIKHTWSGLLINDDGDYFSGMDLADVTIHVFGTFGGAILVFEGSNEDGTPSNPVTLTDDQGINLSFTGNDLKAVVPNPEKKRPNVSGGDGTTNITVILTAIGKALN